MPQHNHHIAYSSQVLKKLVVIITVCKQKAIENVSARPKNNYSN